MAVGAGVVGPGISSGSSGGGKVPANLVEGSTNSSSAVIIPGLSGSADIFVGAGSGHAAFNDEFEQDSSGIPSGWTILPFGTLATDNTNDFLSNLHLKTNTGTTGVMSGIYKAGPAPTFTMTAKITDLAVAQEFNAAGIFYSPVTPGNTGSAYTCIAFCGGSGAGAGASVQSMICNADTGATGSGLNTVATFTAPLYVRMVVTATSVTYYCSSSGLVWTVMGSTTGLTLVTGTVGLWVTSNGSVNLGEAAFDWVRFT